MFENLGNKKQFRGHGKSTADRDIDMSKQLRALNELSMF